MSRRSDEAELVVYCADIGSVPQGRFGWARSELYGADSESHRGGSEIGELVDAVARDLAEDHPVALGFECPLFVPVPEEPQRLGAGRTGDANRPWSAAAGSGVLATGLVQVAWILSELRQVALGVEAHLDWDAFLRSGRGLFLWEAFVTDRAKATTHIDDAAIAVASFRAASADLSSANAVTAERPLSLVGAALLWSGWSDDRGLLSSPCVVIKAVPPAAEAVPTPSVDPAAYPRANRDRREIERKLSLLNEPRIAPLTRFVRRLRDERGAESVPWFDPTEAGTEARILMLFENPGRRADAAHGSGFISPDNNDKSAENMWSFLREAGINRRAEIIAWNIVPWYLGDDRRIGNVKTRDIDQARSALLQLIRLLPELRVVILFGRKAQLGWRRAKVQSAVPVLEAPHPSGRWLNSHPEERRLIIRALQQAHDLALT